ncbi:hypothetical protein Flavo103_20260 [Flavobacterium collinsii]|nr:hypothetical protein Flavo103_20260 [Flavobacterium collinsii]
MMQNEAPAGYRYIYSRYRTIKGKRQYKADGGLYRFLVKI